MKKGQLGYKGQVPNEQFVYKTTPQQRPPLYAFMNIQYYVGQNFLPQLGKLLLLYNKRLI